MHHGSNLQVCTGRQVTKILHVFADTEFASVHRFTNEIKEWEDRADKLKDHRSKWLSTKKIMEEKLSADDNVAKVLEWIKDSNDTESTLAYIENKITPNGKISQLCAMVS